MQRPRPASSGITVRHRNDDVGLPWSRTIGGPLPSSTYAIRCPTTPAYCFLACQLSISVPPVKSYSGMDITKLDRVVKWLIQNHRHGGPAVRVRSTQTL